MRIAILQLGMVDRPKAATLRHVLELLDQSRGNDLVLLPELWPSGFFAFDRYAADSEPMTGPLVQALRAKARDLRVHLHTGSFVERDGPNLFNTALLLSPDGEILARYRKIHLFGYKSEERRLLRPWRRNRRRADAVGPGRVRDLLRPAISRAVSAACWIRAPSFFW